MLMSSINIASVGIRNVIIIVLDIVQYQSYFSAIKSTWELFYSIVGCSLQGNGPDHQPCTISHVELSVSYQFHRGILMVYPCAM